MMWLIWVFCIPIDTPKASMAPAPKVSVISRVRALSECHIICRSAADSVSIAPRCAGSGQLVGPFVYCCIGSFRVAAPFCTCVKA